MKKKDIIISAVAVVAAAAVIICAGAVVKNQIEFASARDALREKACELYDVLPKERVCKYNPKLESEPLDKIIVGMITYPKEDQLAPSIFAVPPTVNEVEAYLSASALFENINMADGRGLNKFLPVYANGKISEKSIFASDKIDINTGEQFLSSVKFVFWKEKGKPELAAKELIVKKGSKINILEKFKSIENEIIKTAHISPYFCLYEILINENGKIVGDNRAIKHSITQPVDIFEIYGNSDLSKICKEAYNPVERVRLKD